MGPAFCLLPAQLDELCFLKSCVRTVLCNSAESFGRNLNYYGLIDFWYENTLLLKVWLTADFATRVELRRTSAVAVSAPDEGLLASNITLLCHNVFCLSCAILPFALNIATNMERRV